MSEVALDRARQVLDAALLAAVALTGLASHAAVDGVAPLGPITALASVALAAPLWWRRSRPLGALAVILAVVVAIGVVEPPGAAPAELAVALMAGLFAVGAWSVAVRRAAVVVVGLFALIVAGALGDGRGVLTALVFGSAVVALPVVAGYAARTRRRYVEEVEARLARAELERDEQARQAINAERARLARELHDVVAHHVSLIGVQAGAARVGLDRSPDATRLALEAIEASSRQAVGELHQLLTVLRPLEAAAPGTASTGRAHEAPQPMLERLPALCRPWREAGLEVVLSVSGASLPAISAGLGPAGSASCYRVVEEAVTNAAKHAGASRVAVDVRSADGYVLLAVADPGPQHGSTAPAGPPGAGRGLLGMAERVALFGGHLAAGPTPEGGFLVVARLPFPPRGASPEATSPPLSTPWPPSPALVLVDRPPS